MKIRITALLFSIAMLTILLSGCACEHEWADATCLTPKTCNLCQETEGESLGHSWADATCAAPKTCTACGETEGETLPHAWVEATYQNPKTCTECGTTEGEPLPTLFEEMGLELWEDFETSCETNYWEDGSSFFYTKGHAEGLKGFMRLELQADNKKWTLRELVDTNVDITICENTHLEHETDFIMEKFRDAYCDETSRELTDEEWMAVCEDYKILSVRMTFVQEVDSYFEELLTAKKRKWNGNNWMNVLALVDLNTGMVYEPTSKNEKYDLVGVFNSDQEKIIMAAFDKDFSYDCMQLNLPKRMNFTQDVIIMLPENYEGIAVRWGEAIKVYTDDEYSRMEKEENEEKKEWKIIPIQEASKNEEYKYYYFSTILP